MRSFVKRALVLAMLLAPAAAFASAPPSPDATGGGANPSGASAAGEAVAFYLIAAAVVASALGCVLFNNIVRMAMCLLGTLVAVALLYFLMAANFLAVIQLIVYAGGTLVVIVFGVMLTSRTDAPRLRPRRWEVNAGLLVCLALFVGLWQILTTAAWPVAAPNPAGEPVARFGVALLTTYLVPFEVASVLLLGVMIGAAYLAQPAGRRT